MNVVDLEVEEGIHEIGGLNEEISVIRVYEGDLGFVAGCPS